MLAVKERRDGTSVMGFSFNANATEWKPTFGSGSEAAEEPSEEAAAVPVEETTEDWETVEHVPTEVKEDETEEEEDEPEAPLKKQPVEEVVPEARDDDREAQKVLEEKRRRQQELLAEEEGAWGDDDDDDDLATVKPPPAAIVSSSPPFMRASSPSPEVIRKDRPPKLFEDTSLSRQQKPLMERRGGASKEYVKPAWARTDDGPKEILKKATSILNKLTFEKFDRLSGDFVALDFDSVELVKAAIDLIVDKAQMETHFVDMYAQLCRKLSATPLRGLGETGDKGKKCRRLLLERCQAEFERDPEVLQAEVEAIEDAEEREEKMKMIRKRYIGHMFFIGALYKHELLREEIMHNCIQELFGDPDDPDEEKLECLAKLLTTIGKQLDAAAFQKKESQKLLKAYFKQLKRLGKSEKLETRIRFSLIDLCDLRDNDWVPRRKIETAKTIKEIHADIQREADIKAGKKPSKKIKSEKTEQVTDDGWETVGEPTRFAKVASSTSLVSHKNGSNDALPPAQSGSVFGAFASLSSSKDKGDKKKKKKKDETLVKKKKKKKDFDSENLASPRTIDTESNGASPVSIDEEAYKKKAKAAIEEYAAIGDLKELIENLRELEGGENDRSLFVAQALDCVLNAKASDRSKFAPMLLALAEAGALDSQAIDNGFRSVLEFLPDIVMDVSPKAHEWLGDVLRALKDAKATDLAFLDDAEHLFDDPDLWQTFNTYVRQQSS